MKTHKIYSRIAALVVLLAVGSACSNVSPRTPTGEPTPVEMRKGEVFLEEDFDTPDDNLWRGDNRYVFFGPSEGGYLILVKDPLSIIAQPLLNPLKYAEQDYFPDDLIINVEVTKRAGPSDSVLAVTCRQNFSTGDEIFFEIQDDGLAKIMEMRNNARERVASKNLAEDGGFFHTGLATNQLHIECVGSDVLLYINGRLALQAQTDILAKGVVRLGAGTYQTAGAEYLYDNLVVEKPTRGPSAMQPTLSLGPTSTTSLPPTLTPRNPPRITPSLLPGLTIIDTPQPYAQAINRWNTAGLKELSRLGKGEALDVDWSPDGGVIAALTSKGIDFYNSETLEKFSTYGIRDADHLKYNPDGKTIAVAKDEEIRIIRLHDGAVLRTIVISTGYKEFYSDDGVTYFDTAGVFDLQISPDGTQLFAFIWLSFISSGGGTVMQVWDLGTGSLILKDESAAGASVSSDGQLVAMDTYIEKEGWSIIIRNSTNWETVQTIPNASRGFAFLPDGHELLICDKENELAIWDAESGILKRKLGISGQIPNCFDFTLSPDGRTLAVPDELEDAGIFHRRIRFWDIQMKKELFSADVRLHSDDPMTFTRDGKYFLLHGQDQIIRVWDIEQRSLVKTIQYTSAVDHLIFPYGPLDGAETGHSSLWAFYEAGNGILWNTADLTGEKNYSGRGDRLVQVVMSPTGKDFAIIDEEEGRVHIIDAESGVDLMPPVEGNDAAFSPDGRQMLIQDYREIRILSTADWSTILRKEDIFPALYRPDGLLVSLDTDIDDAALELRDLSSDTLLAVFPNTAESGTEYVRGEIILNNRYVAAPMCDYTIQLYDLENPEHPKILSGHGFGAATLGDGGNLFVETLVFHPFENILATTGYDGMVFLWNAENGSILTKLNPQCGMVQALAFNLDGRYLAAGCEDGTVHVWGIK